MQRKVTRLKADTLEGHNIRTSHVRIKTALISLVGLPINIFEIRIHASAILTAKMQLGFFFKQRTETLVPN